MTILTSALMVIGGIFAIALLSNAFQIGDDAYECMPGEIAIVVNESLSSPGRWRCAELAEVSCVPNGTCTIGEITVNNITVIQNMYNSTVIVGLNQALNGSFMFTNGTNSDDEVILLDASDFTYINFSTISFPGSRTYPFIQPRSSLGGGPYQRLGFIEGGLYLTPGRGSFPTVPQIFFLNNYANTVPNWQIYYSNESENLTVQANTLPSALFWVRNSDVQIDQTTTSNTFDAPTSGGGYQMGDAAGQSGLSYNGSDTVLENLVGTGGFHVDVSPLDLRLSTGAKGEIYAGDTFTDNVAADLALSTESFITSADYVAAPDAIFNRVNGIDLYKTEYTPGNFKWLYEIPDAFNRWNPIPPRLETGWNLISFGYNESTVQNRSVNYTLIEGFNLLGYTGTEVYDIRDATLYNSSLDPESYEDAITAGWIDSVIYLYQSDFLTGGSYHIGTAIPPRAGFFIYSNENVTMEFTDIVGFPLDLHIDWVNDCTIFYNDTEYTVAAAQAATIIQSTLYYFNATKDVYQFTPGNNPDVISGLGYWIYSYQNDVYAKCGENVYDSYNLTIEYFTRGNNTNFPSTVCFSIAGQSQGCFNEDGFKVGDASVDIFRSGNLDASGNITAHDVCLLDGSACLGNVSTLNGTYVPYTGAIQDVNLGSYDLTASQIDVDSVYIDGVGFWGDAFTDIGLYSGFSGAIAVSAYDEINLVSAVSHIQLFPATRTYTNDNIPIALGSSYDSDLNYNGSDLIINPDAVGSGALIIDGDVAIGSSSKATGNPSFAGGYSSTATHYTSFAYGDQASATNTDAIAMGDGASASFLGAVAIGEDSTASAYDSYALGFQTLANGSFSYALGQIAEASGYDSFAIGSEANAYGHTSIAMGEDIECYGTNSFCISLIDAFDFEHHIDNQLFVYGGTANFTGNVTIMDDWSVRTTAHPNVTSLIIEDHFDGQYYGIVYINDSTSYRRIRGNITQWVI